MQLSLRPATEADLPFLLALRQESMGPHLAAAGLTGSPEDFMQRVKHRFDCAQIILADARPVGLLKVLRGPDSWKVMQLQLSDGLRGQGLGRRLLEDVIAAATRAGVPVTLSVLRANPAKALYERLGFIIVGEDEHEFHMTTLDPGKRP